MAPIVTLLTDFGQQDGYVAAMKGVILSEAPAARLVDAAHGIPPQDVQAGAWALHQYWRFYPKGTVHVAVVDPGVGTPRRGLVVAADGHHFIGPDNGLFAWVYATARELAVHTLREDVHRQGEVSTTFHGRDVFAFAAACLVGGDRPGTLGTPIDDFVRPRWSQPARDQEGLAGEVIHVDGFGNLITNITRQHLADMSGAAPVVQMGEVVVPSVLANYEAGESGALLALFGSMGHLEIAVRNGSAADVLRRGLGAKVRVAPRDLQ